MDNTPKQKFEKDSREAQESDYWETLETVPFLGEKTHQPEEGYGVVVYENGVASAKRRAERFLTRANTLNYGRDRSYENQTMLERKNQFLGGVYNNLMREYPELRNVKLVGFEDVQGEKYRGNAFQTPLWYDGAEKYVEAVYFNFSEPENYLRPENLRKGDTFGLEDVLKQLALKLGLEPEDVMRNEKLVSTFVFAHEMGHAHDFHHNKLGSEIRAEDLDAADLARAVNESNDARRRYMMTWPLPGQLEADSRWKVQRFRKRLIAMGINPDDKGEIRHATSRAYRRMPDEAYADNFASAYVLRHYENYFEAPGARRRDPDKIRPRFGELIDMSGDTELLDLRVGTKFRVAELKTDWSGWPKIRSGKLEIVDEDDAYNFFLAEKIKMGRPLNVLVNFPDPVHGRVMQTNAKVEGVYAMPCQTDKGKVKNRIVMRMRGERGKYTCYQIETVKQRLPKIITSPEKMMARLGLREGSKVQLMKVKLDGNSELDEASVLSGELYRPEDWPGDNPSPIQYGHGIHVRAAIYDEFGDRERYDSNDPYYFPGGNTSGVKEVYRRWNTYYVDTATSTYEVIPFED